jgi:molybdopterin/thiamine biosynthesis adenylyltransferase
MGIDAVAKQATSSVFLSGLGALGVEIAKNITLAGVKRLTLHDSRAPSATDLCGQFFVSESDVREA